MADDPQANIERLAEHRARRRRSGGGAPADARLLDPRYPDWIAGDWLAARWTDAAGKRLLLRHRETFHRYDGVAWRELPEPELRADAYNFMRPAWRQKSGGDVEPFPGDKSVVDRVLDALRGRVETAADLAPPAWLGEQPADLDPAGLVVCANGILDLASGSTLPHTPDLFALNPLPYDFDPHATCPVWLAFLDQVLPDDAAAQRELQKFFGYLLTPKTDLQKGLLMHGLRRSGKGTIGRALAHVVGAANVCSPGLTSLGGPFGGEQLLGKRVAYIADARLSRRSDPAPILETLLAVIGEDHRTVQRKFLSAVHGRLPIRFVIACNELIDLMDISRALAGRFVVLTFPTDSTGREDFGLEAKLVGERSGILNWAIEGLARLEEDGGFRQPPSSAETIRTWEDLSSPIAAWLRDACIVDPHAEEPCDVLFRAFWDWCAEEQIGGTRSKAAFGKELLAAVPRLARTRPRYLDAAGLRPRRYRGLRLRTAIEKAIAEAAEATADAARSAEWSADGPPTGPPKTPA